MLHGPFIFNSLCTSSDCAADYMVHLTPFTPLFPARSGQPFVLHNYVNLNIGLTLTLQQAAAYFIEWTVVGLLIGVIYKPK